MKLFLMEKNKLLKKQDIGQFEMCSVQIVMSSENSIIFDMNETNA